MAFVVHKDWIHYLTFLGKKLLYLASNLSVLAEQQAVQP